MFFALSDCCRYLTKENPTQIFAAFNMLPLKHSCQKETVLGFKGNLWFHKPGKWTCQIIYSHFIVAVWKNRFLYSQYNFYDILLLFSSLMSLRVKFIFKKNLVLKQGSHLFLSQFYLNSIIWIVTSIFSIGNLFPWCHLLA